MCRMKRRIECIKWYPKILVENMKETIISVKMNHNNKPSDSTH